MKRIALVTGANRGIGLQVSRELARRGYDVILTARDEARGREVVATLAREGLKTSFHVLDVTSEKSVEALHRFVVGEYGRLDVLVNNAGILPGREGSAVEAKLEDVRRTFETNTLGPFLMCRRFVPLMRESGYGRVVNVSSGMGQLSEMNGGYVGYRLSKTALNALTCIFADETRGTNVLVNSACPGWVKTDMGGAGAHRTVEEGADGIVWLATLPDDGPTGGFFRDRKPMAW